VHSMIAALLIFGLPVSLTQPQEEQPIKVELVPPPEPAEKEKVEPPPPEKPKPAEKAKVEPPAEKAKAAKPPQPEAGKPPPKSDDAAQAAPVPVLRPVFRFGQKDAGARLSTAGSSAEDGAVAAAAPPKPDKQQAAGPQALAAAGAASQVPQPGAPVMAAPSPADAARFRESVPKLEGAKRLYSQAATGDAIATSAMAGVPRGKRAGQLCVTELREQLLHALPPFFPDLLPFQGLEDGEVIEVPSTAFRAERQWYELSFRCEVDRDATKVVSFAFQVGGPVPHSEWKRRGLAWD
jgi:Domain of Unknown Function (DUF930)